MSTYDELAIIADKAAMRVYERGEFVHRAGEPSDKLFIVHTGQVKVYRLSESGKEQLVRILRPGDFAGENLFSSAAQDSYAEVTQASEICTIYQADMQELLRQYPDISLHICNDPVKTCSGLNLILWRKFDHEYRDEVRESSLDSQA
ncbi:Crp/Fnr family transcriptional regulator [Oligella ureolytica]|nr:cyclic nucleotide-binding domain-containing protein [Oligella ureolytica]